MELGESLKPTRAKASPTALPDVTIKELSSCAPVAMEDWIGQAPSLRAPLLGVCNWAVSVNRMTLQLGDHGRAQVDTGRLVASSLEDKHVP